MDQNLNWSNNKSVLLLNPRWPVKDLSYFYTKFSEWEKLNPNQAFIFLSTSGTTSKELTDTKIVVLNKKALLASAHSVGAQFNFSISNRVVLSLPTYHVGGLSMRARAKVWNQTLVEFNEKWDAGSFVRFINTELITHASLVPTQVYDLVSAKLTAPPSFKLLFVGGGVLSDKLFESAKSLGWNPIMTYGSTETGSMVAYHGRQGYLPLPHASLRVSADGYLEVSGASLFTGYWNCKLNTINDVKNGEWFKTEDIAHAIGNQFEILGRKSDYAKINGEGVYLTRLQNILQDTLIQNFPSFGHSIALGFRESERKGKEVVLFSTLPVSDLQPVMDSYNEKVLPFERIQGFHLVQEIPRTELGKIRYQELK